MQSGKELRFPKPMDLSRVRAFPLAERRSLNKLTETLVDPQSRPPEVPALLSGQIETCARQIREAQKSDSSVILMYGAHLVKNGLMSVVNSLVRSSFITHLATNGAGTIHDWEFAFLGRTEESVRENVAKGCFGTWDETGKAINLAVLAGGLDKLGFGRSLGRYMEEDGITLPTRASLEKQLVSAPADDLAPARAELLAFMCRNGLEGGRFAVIHPNKASSIVWNAYNSGVPLTVHPGIGYDIYATHPWFNGAAVGRAAANDFALFARAVENLGGGVVLSVGSAIMAPQVFEKTLSVVNNLRLQAGRPVITGHKIYVVDIQDGGQWDWTKGEPPKDNPAYYLRFCKTYARMGGTMHYVQCDNRAFLQNLLSRLS